MLVHRFNLRDIREYEDEHNASILKYFDTIRVSNIIDLISLGNGKCSIEQASDILDKYLSSGHTLVDAMIEIRNMLVGEISDTDEEQVNNTISTTKYNSLTELYEFYCMQLMSIGFGYTEFWDLSTKSLYRVFNSINIKRQNEINQSLQLAHTQAALIGQAVWGKLQRKAPHVTLDKPKGTEDAEQLNMINKLVDFANRHNAKIGRTVGTNGIIRANI